GTVSALRRLPRRADRSARRRRDRDAADRAARHRSRARVRGDVGVDRRCRHVDQLRRQRRAAARGRAHQAMTAELLAQIWNEPTDRDVLRVYADWLATNGEPARAEFMQLSLLRERTPAQAKRRNALLAKHRGAWLGA